MHVEVEENQKNMPEEATSMKWLGIMEIVIGLLMLLLPHAVATKAPNGLGLFDMNGNVHEWCLDSYNGHAYSAHKRDNPLYTEKWCKVKVYRGGSWNSESKYARCAARANDIAFAATFIGTV
jgi:hypothetical protein